MEIYLTKDEKRFLLKLLQNYNPEDDEERELRDRILKKMNRIPKRVKKIIEEIEGIPCTRLDAHAEDG